MDSEIQRTKPDETVRTAIEAFRGRELLYFSQLPTTIALETVAVLVSRHVIEIVPVKKGKRQRLALRLIH